MTAASGRDDTGPIPGSASSWWPVVVAGALAFTAMMEMNLANIAVADISRALAVPFAAAQWVVLGYQLPLVALLLPAGEWLQRVPVRPALLLAAGGYGACGVLTALAPDLRWLVAARVVQGAAGAVLFVLMPVLAVRFVPPGLRARALSVPATLAPLGAMTGPSLGGVLVDGFGWRAVFLLKIPLCLLVSVLAVRALPRGGRLRPPGRGPAFDGVLVAAGLTAVLTALTTLTTTPVRPWWPVLVAAAVPPLWWWLRRPGGRRVTGLLRQPGLAPAHAAVCAVATGFASMHYVLALHLQRDAGLSASATGLALLAFPTGMFLAGPLGGRVADRHGSRAPSVGGAALLAAGMLSLLSLPPAPAPWDVAARLAVAGVGLGLHGGPTQALVLGAVPRESVTSAGAALQLARSLGFTLGPAVGTAGWALAGRGGISLPLSVSAGFVLLAVVLLGRPFIRGREPAPTPPVARHTGPLSPAAHRAESAPDPASPARSPRPAGPTRSRNRRITQRRSLMTLPDHPRGTTPGELCEPVPLTGCPYKRDPYPLYSRMRDESPVHRVLFPSGVEAWLVTGYEAAHAALNDDRLGKNHDLGNDRWRARASIMPEPQHTQLQAHLLHQDPPDHTRMRRLVTAALSPHRIAACQARFQEMADALVDALPERGPADLVSGFAAHFPFRVLAEVIGLPQDLAAGFDRDWGKVVQPVGPTDPARGVYERRLRGLQRYIAAVVAHTRAHPGDDLLGHLVAAHDAEELSQEELDSIIFQLLVAGQEPVTNQITTALVTLLRHPGELQRLRNDLSLLPRAVEELLRYDSAFELTTWRFFAEDSDLHGRRIPAGDSVIVSLCAANRDPRRFPDADTLDLERSPNPHLAFGHGIHFCPGASLARTELQIALGTLLTRLPGLRLDCTAADLNWIPSVLGRGTETLPVRYEQRR